MISILAVTVFFVAFCGLCRSISKVSMGKIDVPCPKCGRTLHYHITEEKNEIGLRYVDYWCEHCGWKKRLPEE